MVSGGMTIANSLKSFNKFGTLPQFAQVHVGQERAQYTSYKVAKNVVEFSTSIPRAQLRPGDGAGFLGAPLHMVEPGDLPRERARGGRHGPSRPEHDQGAGTQRPVGTEPATPGLCGPGGCRGGPSHPAHDLTGLPQGAGWS